jgi:hypothetical protein
MVVAPKLQRVSRTTFRKWKRVADCSGLPPLDIDRDGSATAAVREMRRRYGSCSTHPPIYCQKPTAGHRHILTRSDIARFIRLIPDWDASSNGLRAIVLAGARDNCDGWYREGVLAICAWTDHMTWDLDIPWYQAHRGLFGRLGVDIEIDRREITCHWTDATVRAYLLLHVFLHELGHHVDRVASGAAGRFPGGEEWAERFAFEYETLVLERYVSEFGRPY